MKTRAYVIDKKTKDYIRDDKGNHLIVDVNEALDIRDNPHSYREQIHSNRTYMTRNPIPERRVKLFPHRGKKSNCPNCHRQLHYGIDKLELTESMYRKISRLVVE